MAKIKSLFHVSGDVGDAAFIQRNGACFLKQPSRIPKSRIKNAPEFQRTRENMKEFSGAMKTASAMRSALAGVIKDYASSDITTRLATIFNNTLRAALGSRGGRPVELSAHKEKLRGFELDRTDQFKAAFTVTNYTVLPAPARDGASVTIPVFDIGAYLVKPQGATHFKFALAVGALSDYAFDGALGKYQPVSPLVDGIGSVQRSAVFDYDTPLTAPITISASLPSGTVMPATASLIVAIGVEFYQEVNGQLYILSSDNAMKIHEVY